MKTILTITLLLLGWQQAHTQLIHPQDTTIELGVSAVFLNTFLPLDNAIGRSAPFLFSYRKYRPNKKIIRMGLNINLEGVFDNPEKEADRNTAELDIGYRVGWGRQRQIHKRMFVFSGFDLLADFFFSNTTTGETAENLDDGTKRSTYEFGTGVGPFVGLQFNFTDRIGLFTEAAFYIKGAYEIENFRANQQDNQNFLDKQFSFQERFRLPGNLTLFIKL